MWYNKKISFDELYEIWFYKNPPKTYMDIWDEIGFFKREWKQRVQNYDNNLSKQDLDYAWDEYINNPAVKISDLDELWDTNLYILKTKKTRVWGVDKYLLYLYNPVDLRIYERVARKIKKMKDNHYYTYVDFEPHKIDVEKYIDTFQDNS